MAKFKMPFFGPKPTKVGVRPTYGLTPLGKVKAEEYALSGPKWEVLSAMNENGPSTASEVAEELHTSPEKVKSIIRELMKSGYVRRVSAEE